LLGLSGLSIIGCLYRVIVAIYKFKDLEFRVIKPYDIGVYRNR